MTWQVIAASSQHIAKDIAASCSRFARNYHITYTLQQGYKKLQTFAICLPQIQDKLKLTALHCKSIAGNFVIFITSPKHCKKLCSIYLIVKVLQEALSNPSNGKNSGEMKTNFILYKDKAFVLIVVLSNTKCWWFKKKTS